MSPASTFGTLTENRSRYGRDGQPSITTRRSRRAAMTTANICSHAASSATRGRAGQGRHRLHRHAIGGGTASARSSWRSHPGTKQSCHGRTGTGGLPCRSKALRRALRGWMLRSRRCLPRKSKARKSWIASSSHTLRPRPEGGMGRADSLGAAVTAVSRHAHHAVRLRGSRTRRTGCGCRPRGGASRACRTRRRSSPTPPRPSG
jgi:hypothetical protein